jgi:hypothetical protein
MEQQLSKVDGLTPVSVEGNWVEKSGFCSFANCVGVGALEPDPELGESMTAIGIFDTKPLETGGQVELVARVPNTEFTAFVALVKAAGPAGTMYSRQVEAALATILPDDDQRNKFDHSEKASFIGGVRNGHFDSYADEEGFEEAGLTFIEASGRVVMARQTDAGTIEPLMIKEAA